MSRTGSAGSKPGEARIAS